MEEIENSEETENIMQNIGDWSVCEEQCTYPIDDKNNMAELPSYPMEKREQEAFTEVDLEPNPAINLATKLESPLNSHGQSECFDEINSIKMLTSCSKETFEPQIATPVSAGVMFEKSLVGKIQALPICVDGESHVDEIPSDCIEPVQQEVSAEVNVESKLEDVVLAKIESPLNSYEVTSEVVLEETVTSEDTDDVLKLDASDDEELNLYHKSEAESPCSKRHSPSEPSSSGTAGNNSPFSDSENDLPNASISLPIKKRKIEINETASSSCSEDECKIDYANLKPDEIRALIEEARRYGSIKRKCKCPKTKWEDLPIKGPTHPSGKCTIGKGDWSERQSVQCEACSAGICVDRHKQHGRRRRRGLSSHMKLGTKSKAKATIGEDVPIIELSDSEEGDSSSLNTRPTSSNSIVPNMATTSGECIVLSSSEDDEIVCEGIINTDFKNVRLCKQLSDAPEKVGSPDVVVLNASVTTDVSTCIIPGLRATLSSDSLPGVDLPLPQPHPPFTSDLEPWPDCNIDLENWDETYNFLANIGAGGLAPEVSVNAPVEERPSTPEGWSCPICLEPKTGVNEIMSTTCGHVFCGTCIRSAVKLHKKCPTCRKKLTPKQFHKIFL